MGGVGDSGLEPAIRTGRDQRAELSPWGTHEAITGSAPSQELEVGAQTSAPPRPPSGPQKCSPGRCPSSLDTPSFPQDRGRARVL